jgi:hypothetical protein
MRLIALFNLRPGVSEAQYETWARGTDIPTVLALGSIAGFTVHHVTGLLGSDAPPPYRYVEIIDIADMDRFGKDVSGPVMQAIAADFRSMADVVFLTTEPLSDIEPA